MYGFMDSLIVLARMPQQVNIHAQEDDWTGISNPIVRRRLQTRLQQRARRKREAARKEAFRSSSTSSSQSNLSNTDFSTTQSSEIGLDDSPRSLSADHTGLESAVWRLFDAASGAANLSVAERTDAVLLCKSNQHEAQKILSTLQRWACASRVVSHPLTTSPLLVLVKVNLFRALLTNSTTLGFPTQEHMKDEALSPFYGSTEPISRMQALPPALRPTPIQRQVPHHPWIDLIPLTRMRENLLYAQGEFDDMELCGDLIGMFSDSSGTASMMVWGEPWNPYDWEVTETFIKHWGWTIEGCWELFESTNYWRQRRNEEALCFAGLMLRSNPWI